MSHLHLEFESLFPPKAVHDWWTDLSGVGYVGRALLALRPTGNESEAILVETRWKMMGMTKTLVERLTLVSEDHWTWRPTIFGIEITDDFRLSVRGGRTVLSIDSTARARGAKGRLTQTILGPVLDRMMMNEWDSANEAMKLDLMKRG